MILDKVINNRIENSRIENRRIEKKRLDKQNKKMAQKLARLRLLRLEKKQEKEEYKIFAEKNAELAKIAEKEFYKKLKKQYPTLISNSKFAVMDFTSRDNNNVLVEHEYKFRADSNGIKHNSFSEGLMCGKNKLNHSLNMIGKSRQIYYWECLDGIYYWELTKETEDQYTDDMNGNIKNNQSPQPVFCIKSEFLKKF